MYLMFFMFYFLVCAIIGYLGRFTVAGPVGFFLLALIFSPLVALIFFLLTQRRPEPRHHEPHDSQYVG